MDLDTIANEKPKGNFFSIAKEIATWTFVIGTCGYIAWGLISSLCQEEHISLTKKLEEVYQTCQEVEDKSKEVEFAPFVYSSCQEIESLYAKVNGE